VSAKRYFDIVVSAIGLFILTVPLLIVALAVKLCSKGPVLFFQERIGRDGVPFRLYKFRTMRTRTTTQGPAVTPEGDTRVTAIGHVLRRWKVDELPQLWNVLRGDMSIVGPRPEVERFVRHYSPTERRILRQTPGLAGMATLVYPEESEILRKQPDPEATYVEQLLPGKVAVDLDYEERRTFGSDLWLLGQIALFVLGRRGHLDHTFQVVPTLNARKDDGEVEGISANASTVAGPEEKAATTG
jgi:lipopolysaccharide/colanic/teichoic acid biosynthesis glycosyltransferase